MGLRRIQRSLIGVRKSKSFQCLHHRMHGRRRLERVPLKVGFRRRYAKPKHVLFDEFKVGQLAGRWPKNSAAFFGSHLISKFHNLFLSYRLVESLEPSRDSKLRESGAIRCILP